MDQCEHVSEPFEPQLKPLTPTLLSAEALDRYKSDFEYVFANSNIRNIAVSGQYGSGKSTVVDSWKDKYGHGEWLHVSLAQFTGGDKSSDIETALLNQLVYKIDLSKAPKTRFRKTRDRSKGTDFAIAILAVVFIVVSIILGWTLEQGVGNSPVPCLAIIALSIIWLCLACAGSYKVIRANSVRRALKRLKFVNAELEIAESDNASMFDKYMDDLVYLINNSEYDVFVFEDLDRFDSVNLFEKLREVNILANDSRDEKKGREPLRFLYLVRDSLFDSASDRTKFFDYIIPVIPYVDPNNAYEILSEGLHGVGINTSTSFLYQLSLFINDSRMLHDIINEACHFQQSLFENGTIKKEDDAERLVAIIAYKSAFPKDYEKLQIGQGYLFALFSRKHEVIKELTREAEAKKKAFDEELEKIHSRNKFNEDELSILYIAPEFDTIKNSVYYNRYDFPATGTISAEIEAINSNSGYKEAFGKCIAKLKDNAEYQDRLKELRRDADRQSSTLEAAMARIDTEELEYKRQSLSELIEHSDSPDKLFALSDEDRKHAFIGANYEKGIRKDEHFPMLRFLVRRSYIDESYTRFISNFYPGSLTLRDRDYLVSILQGASIDEGYVPDDTGALILRMDTPLFSRRNTKNYCLFRSLLLNGPYEKLEALLSGVDKDDEMGFLLGFVCSDQFAAEVFKISEGMLDQPTKRIIEDENLDEELRRTFCQKALAYSSTAGFSEDARNALEAFAAKDSRFLNAPPEVALKMEAGLEWIKYHPAEIEIDGSDDGLLSYVYSNGFFAATAPLIDSLRIAVEKKPTKLDNGALISALAEDDERTTLNAIADDAELYVRSLLQSVPGAIIETDKAIVWLLSLKSLSEDTGVEFIGRLSGRPVEAVSEIGNKAYKAALLDRNAISCTAQNIFEYFETCGYILDEHLASFINANDVPDGLNRARQEETIGEHDFLLAVIACSIIHDEKVGEIARSYGIMYDSFEITDLAESRMNLLLECGVMQMNAEMLSFMRKHYKNCVPHFAATDIREYTNLVLPGEDGEATECGFDEDEARKIFEEKVPVRSKITLLGGFDTAKLSESYEDDLNNAIMKFHFDATDVKLLPKMYTRGNKELKDTSTTTAAANLDEIAKEHVVLPVAMTKSIMALARDSRETAISALSVQLEATAGFNRNRTSVKECCEAAGLTEYISLLDGHASMIPSGEPDDGLIEQLQRLSMCGKSSGEANTIGMRRVYPKRHK